MLHRSCLRYTKLKNGSDSTLDNMKESIAHTGFFENSFSASRLIGRAYNKGNMIETSEQMRAEEPVTINTDNAFSPSAIETYLSCPRKYYFSIGAHPRSAFILSFLAHL